MFETTIRVVGGMLSAYELTQEDMYLARYECMEPLRLEIDKHQLAPDSWFMLMLHVRLCSQTVKIITTRLLHW